MPKATYDADFSTFRREVESAIVTMKGFEGEAENVAKSLSDMTNRFTGVAVIQQATLMAKAVENVGGVSKLTARELETLGNVSAEAVFKLQAWGQQVPENLARYAQHATTAASATRELGGAAGALSTSMVALGTFIGDAAELASQKIVGLVTDTLRQAQALRALSNETGIAVEEIQVLGEMFRESGVTGEQMGKAIDALARRVSGDKSSASGAFHELGIAMEDLKGKTPVELLKTAMGLLDNMSDRARAATIAGDLFGERLGAAALKVAHNFEEMHRQATLATSVMTKEQAEKVAQMADAWERFKTAVSVETAEILFRIAAGMRDANDAIDKGVPLWKVFLADQADKLLKDLPYLRQYATVLHDIAQNARIQGGLPMMASHGAPPLMASHGAGGRALTEDEEADAALAAILKDREKELTDRQRERLERLYDEGILTAKNAESVKVTVDQMEKFRHEQDEIIARQARLSTELRDYSNLQVEVTKRYLANQDAMNTKAETQLHLQTEIAGTLIQANAATLEALQRRALGPGATDQDPVIQAITERNKRLRELEREQEEEDEKNADIRKRNFQRGLDIFEGREPTGGFEAEIKTRRDRSVEEAKIWADFEDTLKRIRSAQDGVTGGFNQMGDAAARAAGAITKAFPPSAKPRFEGDIMPWSDLTPRPIDIKPIRPGTFGGVQTVNVQVSGVIDTNSSAMLTDWFSKMAKGLKQWQTA